MSSSISLPSGIIYLALFGAPAAWACRLAWLSRTDEATGNTEWYPIGRILLHGAGATAIGLIIVGFIIGYDPGAFTTEITAALVEWLREWLFTGFPWLYLGYAHLDTWLSGWAPITGVFGLSFICAISGTCLFLAWRSRKLVACTTYTVALVTLWGGGAVLKPTQWVAKASEQPITVALVQLQPLMSVEPGPGVVFFMAVVILTVIAVQCFDPRLIWDAGRGLEVSRA